MHVYNIKYMRCHKFNKLFSVIFIISLVSTIYITNFSPPVDAAETHTLRALHWQRTDYSYDSTIANTSMTEMRATIPHSNYIYIDVWGQINSTTSTVTPDLDDLNYYNVAITKIQASDADPMVRIRMPSQTSLDPANKTEFYASYAVTAAYWAEWAENRSIPYFCLGVELTRCELPAYNAEWQNIVSEVRAVYSGIVFYETNFWVQNTGTYGSRDQKYQQTWFADLDYLAVSTYWDIAPSTTATVQEMINEWYDFGWLHTNVVTEQIGNISDAHGVDIILVTGCASNDGAAMHPWNFKWVPEVVDVEEQRRWFQAFFTVFYAVDYVHGFMIDGAWFTEADKDPDNNEFTVQNKPAEDTIESWYTQSSYEPGSATTYYFADSFDTGDFSGWTGIFETNSTYHWVDVATNNPYNGTYNLNATIIQNSNNVYACAYQSISGVGDTAYLNIRNAYFDTCPDADEYIRVLGFAANVSVGTLLVSAGITNSSGAARWVMRGIENGTTAVQTWIGNTTTLDYNYDSLQLGIERDTAGWYKFWVNGVLELAVSVDNTGRSLNQAAVGMMGSHSPATGPAYFYCDEASVNSTYMVGRHLLHMLASAGGDINPGPSGSTFEFQEGTNVTLSAEASTGYLFTCWNVDGANMSSNAEWWIVMNTSYTVTAYFTLEVSTYPVNLIIASPLNLTYAIADLNITFVASTNGTIGQTIWNLYNSTGEVYVDQAGNSTASLTSLPDGYYHLNATANNLEDYTDTAEVWFTVAVQNATGSVWNLTDYTYGYTLEQANIVYWYGSNSSVAINYVMARGETLYLGEGVFTENGASGSAIAKIEFYNGSKLYGDSLTSSVLVCRKYSLVAGDSVIGRFTLKTSV